MTFDWDRLATMGGNGAHLPALIDALDDDDQLIRDRAYRNLMHDVLWNGNLLPATPAVVSTLIERLQKGACAHPVAALAILEASLYAESAVGATEVSWRGEREAVIPLVRRLVEGEVDLYARIATEASAWPDRKAAISLLGSFRVDQRPARLVLDHMLAAASEPLVAREIEAAIVNLDDIAAETEDSEPGRFPVDVDPDHLASRLEERSAVINALVGRSASDVRATRRRNWLRNLFRRSSRHLE